ncbi:glycosyltransferase family 39 protein [Candidatus Woesebacteria bacterium]|nr:glycosyltransferase family 39 protein [Candidatus Woesebacteria bacterium]
MKLNKLLLLIVLLASLFRFWKLPSIPVSLFGDELDVGYHAYSILKTGRDYSGNFMPLHFQSLAEWRTPLYLYAAVPTVGLFGISPLGVRLPAAIFGILGIWGLYLLVREITKNEKLALISAFVLALSPWHIQYSRGGFEATMLISFLLFGLYFFFRSLQENRFLWISVAFLVFTPWIYSTAKLFTPIMMAFLFLVWRKDILRLPKASLIKAAAVGFILGIPIAYSTIFGGGAQRFSYLSVFSDPTTEPEVGTARLNDARVRGELGTGLNPTFIDRVLHNKFTFWGTNVTKNYFESFSTEFLFTNGDLNLRHSIGMGEFYKIEALALLLGMIFFFTSKTLSVKHKALVVFWILVGVIPAAITREGGKHATRLILILPPMILLISYGMMSLLDILKGKFKLFPFAFYLSILALCFGIYLHNYYSHYPWTSERWWHAGWREGISSIKEIGGNYDKIGISMAGEPAWIFFAGHYMYPPDKWQKDFPIGNDIEVAGFGKVSHIDKFYFGSPSGGLYEWGQVMDSKTLYLANASEVKINLILEPERTPGDLTLLKSIAYPSGEPAMYLFAGK